VPCFFWFCESAHFHLGWYADQTKLFLAAALASDPDLLDQAVEFVARAMADVIVDRAIDLFALAKDSDAVGSASTSVCHRSGVNHLKYCSFECVAGACGTTRRACL
jgi:hypothetical protein